MIREKSSGQRKNPGRTPIFKRKTEVTKTEEKVQGLEKQRSQKSRD